jgi:hypothetical protein
MSEEKPKEKTKEPEEEGRYSLKEVTTKTDYFVEDTKTKKVFTEKGLLIEILNKLDKIEQGVA